MSKESFERIKAGLEEAVEIASGRADPATYNVHNIEVEVRISKITGKPVQKRGFAAMSIEKRTDLARKGGASVDPNNRSFSKNRDLAATAGRKGGFGRHKALADD